MKKIILFTLAVVCLSSLSASADSFMYRKHYRGNAGVGVIGAAGKNMFEGFVTFETNHGYSFGNGLYVGGGISCSVHADSDIAYVPVYGEAKYNFTNTLVSPFVDARIGTNILTNTNNEKSVMGFMASPMIGVDIWRFTLGFFYQYSPFGSSGVAKAWGLNLYFNW